MKIKIVPFAKSVFVCLAALAISCGNNSNKKEEVHADTLHDRSEPAVTEHRADSTRPPVFDIQKITISEKEIGDFPFFSLPKGLQLLNKRPIERKFDQLFFPIHGIMTPLQGRVWKAGITSEGRRSGDWSLIYFTKSYEEAILSAGGVKVFDDKVSREELDRIKDEATYFGESGSIDYWNSKVKVYLIRRADGANIYVQFAGNSASGAIQILQEEAFQQTITMITSDEISTQLKEKGKAVLYINFDTDKALLKPDGLDAVQEISKVLKADNELNLEINGYTDNAGSPDHNKKLSEERAENVKNELIKSGIASGRLTSNGYGQGNPITDNANEDARAKNRRVELVKK